MITENRHSRADSPANSFGHHFFGRWALSTSVTERIRAVQNDQGFQDLRAEHPLQAKLIIAALERLFRSVAIFDEHLAENRVSGDTFTQFHQLSTEYSELCSWAGILPQALPEEELDRSVDQLREAGLPWQHIKEYLELDNPRGRPGSRTRQLAVHALEQRRLPAPPSWRQIAISLKYCDDDPDVDDSDFRCKERLRKQVKRLEDVLAKYKIES